MQQNIPRLTENQVIQVLYDIFLNQIERIDMSNVIINTNSDYKLSEFESKFIRFVAQKGGELERYLPNSEKFSFDKTINPKLFQLELEDAFALAQNIRLLQNLLAGLFVEKVNVANITVTYK